MSESSAETRLKPLGGLRVIDAASLAAAPLVATYLAEFGAEVIKVEQPGVGDALRNWGTMKNGVGLMWKSVARNKKTVTLNLRTERGQEILCALAARADVLIVNTRPSTLARWGLDYARLQKINPQLIFLHITAFGEGGPASDRPGFGTLGEAMSGFAHTTGEPDGPPTLPSFMLADGVASLNACVAVMIALYHREVNGGGGQHIDVNLIEPLARLLEQSVLTYDQLGEIQQRTGNRWAITVPRNTYLTRDDRWIAMSGSAPSIALRVFRAIGRADLIENPEFADAQARLRNADAIDSMVAEWVRAHDLVAVMQKFEAENVAVAPVYDAAQLLEDEHLRARSVFVEIDDPDLNTLTVQGPVARLSQTPGHVDHLGRDLGADNGEVYRDWLGFTSEQLCELRTDGTI